MYTQITLSNEQARQIAYDWYDEIVMAITNEEGENEDEKTIL